MLEFIVQSLKRYQLINITEKVRGKIKELKAEDGLVLIFTLHSTAGIFLTENEEGLKKDFLKFFEKITSGFDFLHNKIDNNADSHILSALMGQGKLLAVEQGKLVLGAWQEIFLAEFDGPRQRKVFIKILEK